MEKIINALTSEGVLTLVGIVSVVGMILFVLSRESQASKEQCLEALKANNIAVSARVCR